jgi:hypothetical protein
LLQRPTDWICDGILSIGGKSRLSTIISLETDGGIPFLCGSTVFSAENDHLFVFIEIFLDLLILQTTFDDIGE